MLDPEFDIDKLHAWNGSDTLRTLMTKAKKKDNDVGDPGESYSEIGPSIQNMDVC